MIQEPISTEETWLQGIPVSPGIALGKIKIQISGSKEPVAYDISPEEVDSELVRFHRALQTTADQIRTLRERMIQISGEKDASIFDAHILLLQDKIILQQVQTELLKRLQNVEHIFYVVMQNYMEVLRRVDDPYLRAKTADMEDVMQRVINNLRSTEPPEDEEETEKDQVLVAYDLTPSDTAAMDASLIHGFATEIGSSVSHTAILARSMGIPAVVGLDQALLRVESHSPAILDGYKGVLILKPTKETEEYYHRLQVEKEKAYKALEALRDLPTITRDGRNIRLSVNVEFPHEYSGIKEVGAEGVGLFRTEFFLLSNPSGMPDEEEQTRYYRKLAEGCSPHGVIFRTLDSGGDKLPCEQLRTPEPNPFLGWRGIRVSLSRPELFKQQLRAILRACADTPGCGIMFPMVTSVWEVREAKKYCEEVKRDLKAEGIPFAEDVQVGIMIETPAAAIMSDRLAKEVDFFSCGTNDLTQYTLACDRQNNDLGRFYDPHNPAVLRLLKMVTENAHKNGIWVGICGELGADLTLTETFLAIGVDELSVSPRAVLPLRNAVRMTDTRESAPRLLAAIDAEYPETL